MFWNFVKKYKFKSISLAKKLTFLYMLSTFFIIAGTCIYLYPSFQIMTQEINRAHLLQLDLAQRHLLSSQGVLDKPFDVSIIFVCIRKFIIGTISLIIASLIFGYLIAERTMRKVVSLSLTMKSINAKQLNNTLDLSEWPSELIPVASTFNDMLARLQASFTTLSQFSADLAHELRTPLNNLRGMIEITLSKDRNIEEHQNLLCKLSDELESLSQLTENLLFLARVDANRQTLMMKSCSLAFCINKIIEFYAPLSEEKGVTVACQGDATVKADSILLSRVISNCLSNALRYTSCGGKIDFKIIASDDDMVTLQIQDTGEGIASEHIPHIFKRFYRADASRSEDTGGSGLGLAISHAIIKLHHGTISLISTINTGTCFTIKLPKYS